VALAAASGNFQVPVVAGDAQAGLAANGRTAVLIESPASGLTRFAVVDRQEARLVRVISLRGDYGFDATSPDGKKLYVIQYRSRDHRTYAIQALSTSSARPSLQTVVEKGEPGERMSGLPITRASSPDGTWVYTLYDGSGGHEPFIHALAAKDAFTVCIDLDALAGRRDLSRLRLTLTPATLTVHRADGKPLVNVSTESFEAASVSATVAPKAAQPKPTDTSTDRTWPAAAITALVVLALATTQRARRRRKLSSNLSVNT
jgi:hypothetical protein